MRYTLGHGSLYVHQLGTEDLLDQSMLSHILKYLVKLLRVASGSLGLSIFYRVSDK